MIISFVGCPCSGKTTTAAMSFGILKDYDIAAEFIPEQARWYIAEKRNDLNLPAGSLLGLDLLDQEEIFDRQAFAEYTMIKSCPPETVLVCDSSLINTLLYLGDKATEEQKSIAASRYDLIFYCPPVKKFGKDSNRVHTKEQALELDQKIPALFTELGITDVITLYGDSRNRSAEVVRHVLDNSDGL